MRNYFIPQLLAFQDEASLPALKIELSKIFHTRILKRQLLVVLSRLEEFEREDLFKEAPPFKDCCFTLPHDSILQLSSWREFRAYLRFSKAALYDSFSYRERIFPGSTVTIKLTGSNHCYMRYVSFQSSSQAGVLIYLPKIMAHLLESQAIPLHS